MKRIQASIASHQASFAALPFFRRLDHSGPVEDAWTFLPDLTFFVLAFQDMLRLNEERIEDPALRRIATHHRSEDSGHEQWFLNDLERLGLSTDVRTLFGTDHEVPRDTAYALVAEVLRASSDASRLAVLLVLESTGEVFFSRIHRYLERAGFRGELEYFSRRHHEVEQGHELFEAELQRELDAMKLAPAICGEVLALVERSFAAMRAMVTAFEERIVTTGALGLGAPHGHEVAAEPSQ